MYRTAKRCKQNWWQWHH